MKPATANTGTCIRSAKAEHAKYGKFPRDNPFGKAVPCTAPLRKTRHKPITPYPKAPASPLAQHVMSFVSAHWSVATQSTARQRPSTEARSGFSPMPRLSGMGFSRRTTIWRSCGTTGSSPISTRTGRRCAETERGTESVPCMRPPPTVENETSEHAMSLEQQLAGTTLKSSGSLLASAKAFCQ